MVTIYCKGRSFEGIEAIIFDKDGTLEDSQQFLRELAYRRSRRIDAQVPGAGEPLLMAFGVSGDRLNPAGLMAVGSRGENEIAAAAYVAETGRSWFEARELVKQAFLEADRQGGTAPPSPLFPGVLALLKRLAASGVKLGILSADTPAAVADFIQRHQLSPYLQLGLGVEIAGLSKPDPRLFAEACDRLGVLPERTLMVGDSQGDMEMAKAAGCAATVGICWTGTQNRALAAADALIFELADLKVS
ncbi:MAG: HAD family hydrolase [Chloroflexaceae bacterium]|nr:HAD family hydrolase [Chloroflexaceae bacterium]